ncbi:hypothetical protein DIU36_01800 [Mucilaginibacter rubeus]|nr:hypothetical protein [Mucilaginibacter rubeus]RAV60370.1 hypothetical protein DIU36_01800 [Mucilaginibacter rubeus]
MNNPNQSPKVSAVDNGAGLSGMCYQLDEFYLDLQEDGNHIRLLTPAEIKKNPFPGLRPYRTSEFQLFKGRGGQAEELIRRLQNNKFLAVIGSSGTGKSSLVRAGLIPQLFGGYLHGTSNRWDVAICRPGADPIENLAIALASIRSSSRSKEVIEHDFREIYPQLLRSIYGLLDVARLLNEGKKEGKKRNLLVIIDQFEELFRFTAKSGLMDGHQTQFVNLLLKAATTKDDPVYVITTMRSEFLGDCVRFQGLPEAINRSQYLVPQLDRPQLKEVIEGPLLLAEKSIASGLIELLINKIEENKLKDNLDQLPILQHALMRTYRQSSDRSINGEIVYDDYKAVGGMEESLSRHASDKFRELGDKDNQAKLSKKQQIAKLIFQAITDQSKGGQKGGRRPLPLGKIYDLCKPLPANEEEINAVIAYFRATDTSFLMPPPSTPLNPELVIDISHESLMRNWVELRTWINEETANGKLYTRLNERRELYEHDPSDVIKGVLLRELKELVEKIKITAAWASRYHQTPQEGGAEPDHEFLKEKNLAFLDYSIRKEDQETEEQKLEIEAEVRRQERERNRKILMFILSFGLVLTLIVAAWAIQQKAEANRQKAEANKNLVEAQKSARIAQNAKIRADKYLEQTTLVNNELIKSQAGLQLQLKHNDSLTNSLRKVSKEVASQKKAIELQLTINALQKEHFYKVSGLSDKLKGDMLGNVLKGKLERSGTVDVEKYIDNNKLQLLNRAAIAFDTIPANAILGLRMADTLWNMHSENIYLSQIIRTIFETNLFPDNILNVGDDENLKISPAGTDGFYAIGSDSLFSLRYDPVGKMIELRQAYRIKGGSLGWKAYISINNNGLLALDRGNLIYWDKGCESLLDTIPSPAYAVFTPGGKQLITSLRDSVTLWNLDQLKTGPGFGRMKGKFLTAKQNIKGLTVSPDGLKLLIQTSEYDEAWDINNMVKLTLRNNYYLKGTNYVSFTPNSDNLLVVWGNSIYLTKFDGRVLNIVSWPLPGNGLDQGYNSSKIDKIMLSADWKKAIVLSRRGTFLIESAGDSLLHNMSANQMTRSYARKKIYPDIKVKRFSNGNTPIKDAKFIDDITAVMTDNDGLVSLWNTRNNSRADINESFGRLKGFLKQSEEEKLESGLLSYDYIMHSNNVRLVRKSVFYFFPHTPDSYNEMPMDTLIKVKALLTHALQINHTSQRRYELWQLAMVNNQMIAEMPEVDLSVYSEKAKLSAENIKLYNEYLALTPNDAEAQRLLSVSYGSLSFYKIFERDYTAAIAAAKKGLELGPGEIWIYTNLALGNLLQGNYTEAELLYRNYKDVLYRSQTIKVSFLDDFEKMQQTKVITGKEPAVLKIKEILNANP